MWRLTSAATLLAVMWTTTLWAQAKADAAAASGIDTMPILRLEAGGPTSFVAGVAFNPQGTTLYAGGWDKVVRAWTLDPPTKRFTLDAAATYRVPIGPGLEGVINAIAVSPDGLWLAVGGRSLVRGASDQRHPGWKVPAAGAMTPAMRLDQGTIYLFNTRTREVRTLRGHTAPVVALAFAPVATGKTAVLVSAGQEWDAGKNVFTASVRAWDVAKTGYLGGVMLPDVTMRPGIAPWHSGKGPKQLRVGIAWGDKTEALRVWDLESGAVRTAPDGQFNNTVAWWPEQSKLVTGSTGRIKIWNVPAGAAPTVDREVSLGDLEVPRTIALFSSQERGGNDRVAAVVKSGRGEATVRLRAVDLKSSTLITATDVALWDGAGVTPTLATATGGRYLAVAGNPTHEIATLSAAEVLAGRGAPTMLRGAGIVAGDVAFVTQGETLGVWVGRAAKRVPGEVPGVARVGDSVFDPVRRRFDKQVADWQPSRPTLGGWRAEAKDSTVTVFEDGKQVREIRLAPARKLTDFALLPPRAALGVPILAVATQELGQPLVELYDVSTGAAVRELAGHSAAVHALAFSHDGRLLVSAAGDRTIAVWNLADLDQIVGKRGTLSGVAVEANDGALRVVDVTAESPYRDQLAAGDKLLSWRRDSKLAPLTAPIEFYLGISRVKPGQSVEVTRERGGQRASVQLVVAQGTDERKPLVALFIAGDAAQDWIGWSPLGPYESSGDAAEQLLGWHFNTGLASQPARFAAAGEYRHLRREGLVEQLLRQGALIDAPPPRLERPSTSIRIKQPGFEPLVALGQEPLRIIGKSADLEVELRGLETDEVAAVSARIGDGPAQPLTAVSRHTWSVGLAQLPGDRQTHPLRIEITTRERQPQTFSEIASLLYRPAPPTIEQVQPAAELSVVRQAAARVRAVVRSGAGADAELAVRLSHVAGDKTVAQRILKGNGSIAVDEAIELREGDNVVSLVATNGAGEADLPADERTIVVRRFTLSPEAVTPPQISIEAIAADGSRRILASDQGSPLVVDGPQLGLEGSIVAKKPLALAEWLLEKERQPLKDFEAGRDSKLAVRELLTLKPGPQRVAVRAQATGGEPTEVSLLVDYRPALPAVVLVEPKADRVLVEGRDEARVQFVGRWEPLADSQPFESVVLLNGKPLEVELKTDAAAQTVSGQVNLVGGDNTIAVQMTNAWGARFTSPAIHVSYLRPPRVVEISAVEKSDKPLVDVTFVVETDKERGVTAAEINGWEVPLEGSKREPAGADLERITVVARNVPLKEGINELRPLARNADGWSVLTKTAQIQLMVAPPSMAEIEWVEPRIDRTVETSKSPLRFVVRSASRIERVELHKGGQRAAEIDVSKQVEQPAIDGKPGGFQLEAISEVTLEPRDNHLRALAVNAGGESTAEITVTYVRKPVEIVIDRIESVTGGATLAAQRQEGGHVRFSQPALEGSVWLHGRVRWPDAASRKENPVSVVQVWVNGFLQQPILLRPKQPNDLEWTWRARLRLNRGAENEVSVRLPDLVRSSDSRTDFRLACSKPDERQRLHLLVVGVGETDARQLESLALRAVRGKRASGDQISTPAFDKGWIYLLSGYVNRGRITAQLERIQLRVGDPADAGADVVMVYYRGQETLDDAGQFYLLTSQSRFDPDMRASSVSGRDLSQRFANVPGAQLFLLDVERRVALGADQNDRLRGIAWPTDRQMAALRYAWLSSEAAPADARLLLAVDNAVPRANRLGEIADEVARDSERVTEKYGATFQYEPRVPDALRYLMLVKPTMVN